MNKYLKYSLIGWLIAFALALFLRVRPLILVLEPIGFLIVLLLLVDVVRRLFSHFPNSGDNPHKLHD